MTKFSQVELIYNQIRNLTSEIDEFIAKEDFLNADKKVKAKDKLIKKFFLAQKTTIMTEEESSKLSLMQEEIRTKNQSLINLLKQSQKQVAQELNKLKEQSKINSAYKIKDQEPTGNLIDTEE